MISSHIAHDCKIGNNVIIANNVAIAGHVEIDDNVIIGGNSAVQQFTRIGKLAMIGGMTGVEKDVIPYGLVTGNRSHLDGINIVGLKRAGYSSEEINALNQAVKLIFSNILLKNGIEEAKKFSNFKTVCDVISFLEKSEKRPICRPIK
jgi:UDP-N-acetylglucosamine acyltransferase